MESDEDATFPFIPDVIYTSYHEHTGLLAIHETLWDGIWSEDFIPEKSYTTFYFPY